MITPPFRYNYPIISPFNGDQSPFSFVKTSHLPRFLHPPRAKPLFEGIQLATRVLLERIQGHLFSNSRVWRLARGAWRDGIAMVMAII